MHQVQEHAYSEQLMVIYRGTLRWQAVGTRTVRIQIRYLLVCRQRDRIIMSKDLHTQAYVYAILEFQEATRL